MNSQVLESTDEAIDLNDDRIRQFIDERRWYAPIGFGNGIVAPCWNAPDTPLSTPHMGASRFEFILRRNMPDLQGKRVLDIGCNAGAVALHMARCGAREVVGVDSDKTWPGWLEQAKFVKRALEWRCATRYNLVFHDCDMRELPKLDLGRFDVVTALCCLYYIETSELEALVQHVASIADVFLVQGNTVPADHRQSPETKRHAHPHFLRRVLQANGFPFVTVDAPWFYGRPVVVGRKSALPATVNSPIRRFLGRLGRKASYIPHRMIQFTAVDN